MSDTIPIDPDVEPGPIVDFLRRLADTLETSWAELRDDPQSVLFAACHTTPAPVAVAAAAVVTAAAAALTER